MSSHLGDVEKLVWAYALKNALDYNGKAMAKSVIAKIFKEKPELRSSARQIVSIVNHVVEEVNKLPVEEQEKLFEKYRDLVSEPVKKEKELLPPLPNAEEGKVVTRFAPNPDFVIHLGNARPAILSHDYARKYKGRFILRFEDTDPRTKTPIKEVYDLIKEDLAWLGIKWDAEYIQSLRMETYYDIARQLISRGGAYVDTCPAEESRKLISEGRGCPTRDNPVEWHLENFEKMIEGYYDEGEAVLRVKTDLGHPDRSVRDWVAFRIIDTEKYPHPIVGSKYVAWPTYNYAVSVDDHLMGVTHILRGKEHMQNSLKQRFLFNHMGWEYPVTIHFGRVHFEGFIMSKSMIRELISREPEKYWGFDDPRFGTIRGLRRRGILPEAIRELILQVGIKGTDARITYTNLAAINRKLLDEKAHRIMYVEDYAKMRVRTTVILRARTPVHPSIDMYREYVIHPDSYICVNKKDAEKPEIRLIGLGNFRVTSGILEYNGDDIKYARERSLPLAQWVPCDGAVETEVYRPVGLEFDVKTGYAEPALASYKAGDKLQFIRYGFVRIDSVHNGIVRVIYTHD